MLIALLTIYAFFSKEVAAFLSNVSTVNDIETTSGFLEALADPYTFIGSGRFKE